MILKLEPSLRKWSINFTKSDLELQAHKLKTAKAKLTNTNSAHRDYEIKLEFAHESLVQVLADQRIFILQDCLLLF